MFCDVSWFRVLLGMNLPFEAVVPETNSLTKARLILEKKRNAVEEMSVKLPNYCHYLTRRSRNQTG